MTKPQKFTAEQVETALRGSYGLVAIAAQTLKCDQQTVRNYMARYASVRRAVDESRELFVDVAELKLVEAVQKKGEPWAIAMVLKTLGKKRGYVERNEVTGADGAPVQQVTYDLSGFSTDEIRGILTRAAPGTNETRALPAEPD